MFRRKEKHVLKGATIQVKEKNYISSIAFVLILYFVLTDDLQLYNYLSEIKYV